MASREVERLIKKPFLHLGKQKMVAWRECRQLWKSGAELDRRWRARPNSGWVIALWLGRLTQCLVDV